MKMIELVKCFEIAAGDVISIVGAGGKTSLICYLASVLGGKTLVMPSTKMYRPKEEWPLQMDKKIEWHHPDNINETIVTAKGMSQGKLAGINPLVFNGYYDHVLIEADGSKGRGLKGWRHDEPVVIKETTLTVGIVDITTVGMTINTSTIHRLAYFRQLTAVGDKVTLSNLTDVICHPKGLFKDSHGKKLLFINKVESIENMADAEGLLDLIEMRNHRSVVDRIVIGSVYKKLGCVKR